MSLSPTSLIAETKVRGVQPNLQATWTAVWPVSPSIACLPHKIISYADRRYFNGDLYRKLGFTFIKFTSPNYWYFKKGKLNREHRYKYRKDVLVREGYDTNKTEHEIMGERGYYRIYDCGNFKFEFTKKWIKHLK